MGSMVRTLVIFVGYGTLSASSFAKSIVSEIQVQRLVQTKTPSTEASSEYKTYNENPANYPAARILNLLHSFPYIPRLFSSNSSNETLDESEYNSTEYQYHNNVFNDSDFEYDLF